MTYLYRYEYNGYTQYPEKSRETVVRSPDYIAIYILHEYEIVLIINL